MTDHPDEIDVEISFIGADEAAADELRTVFSEQDEDVIFSHAFGGADVVTILTKLATPLTRLIQYLSKSDKEITAKGNQITVKGYSSQEVLALCASPEFRSVFRPRRNR